MTAPAATVQAESWPAPINASPEAIKAAIYAGSSTDGFRFQMVRSDGWELWGIRDGKRGWNIRTGRTRPRYELSAVSPGSKYADRRLRSLFPWALFNRFEYFDDATVENTAIEFLGGASPPASFHWIEMQP